MAGPVAPFSPLNRPDGSAHTLRYRGTVGIAKTAGGADIPLATFPKPNTSFPSDTAVVTPVPPVPAPPNPLAALPFFVAYARFALFDPGIVSGTLDAAALANQRRRFPQYLYGDDAQFAAASPHAPIVAAGVAGLVNGELILNTSTWAQSLQLRSSQVDLNVIAADLGIAALPDVTASPFGSFGSFLVRDTATGGLGLDTGLPVLVVPFCVLATTEQTPALQPFSVDLTIEIPHSSSR